MKKVVSLLVVVLLVAAMAMTAVAEGVPSKTTGDMYDSKVISGDAEGMAIVPLTDKQQPLFETISDFINKLAGKVVDFFGADAKDAIAKLLPDVDVDALEIAEAGTVIGYENAKGEVVVEATFPEEFAADDKVVTVLGTYGGADATWTALKTEVVDGKVQVTFPQEAIEALQGSDNNIVLILK